MEYRGKHYFVVENGDQTSWRWAVNLDELTTMSGEATSRSEATMQIVLLIDRRLRAPHAAAN